MKLSDFSHVSTLMITKHRIEKDLALLDDADREQLNTVCVDLVWLEFPKNQHYHLFQSEGGPRPWASGAIHENFAEQLRALARKFLTANLEFCHDALERLGVQLGNA